MEQSIILSLIGLGTITTILLLYYSLKISSYCCLENTTNIKIKPRNITRPPRWSQSLASKVEYIDDTALDVIREKIEHIEKLVVDKLGVIIFVSRDESIHNSILLNFKFISAVSKKTGVWSSIKLLLELMYLKRLYKKASKLSNINKRRREYHDMIEKILEHVDHVATRLEALWE